MRCPALLLTLMLCARLAAEAPPAWVRQGGADPGAYPPGQYLCAYGVSSPGGTPAEQRDQALAMAQKALAAAIRTHVTAEFTSKVVRDNQQMARFAQNLVRTEADVELEGLDTVEVWADARLGTTHALAVLDKARTVRLLDDRLARQARACAAAFDRARAAGDPEGLLAARRLRSRVDEDLLVRAVLGGPAPAPACPALTELDPELRRAYLAHGSLDGFVAAAALDLGGGLPQGIRVLMDRITYADTPFCGSASAWLEQALASHLVACGQVRIVDKAAGREALREGGLEARLATALRSQAVVHGTCFALGTEVQFTLRVTDTGGEDLAAATLKVPAELLRKAGLKLVPDNYEEARKALAICDAQVRTSTLKVKLALDRGDGGIYRKGDKLYLFLKANMDCYVRVLYHQVDGTNVEVFPNRWHPGNQIQKDRLYQIPPQEGGFELEVQPPFGVEMIKLMASTDPLDPAAQAPDPSGLRVVRDDLATALGRTRGLRLQQTGAQFAEDTAVVNTMD